MKEQRLAELIEIAIRREKDAFAFYTELSGRVAEPAARETIAWIATEEQKHRAFLEEFRRSGKGPESLRFTDVVLYKIAEHLEEPDLKTDMRSEDVFLLASHREMRSYRFYSEMGALYDEGDTVREMLLKIANEELKHKEKMEYLYANTAFPQTAGG
jgi:rubrerythrin